MLLATVSNVTGGGRSLSTHLLLWAAALAFLGLTPNAALGQTLTPITLPPNGFSAVPLFEDSLGNRYAARISVHFGEHVFDLPSGQRTATPADMQPGYPAVAALFSDLEADHGTFTLEKVVPEAAWGDTLTTNLRTGATVSVSDYSQLFLVHFSQPVPLTDVTADFEALSAVDYAEGPEVQVALGSVTRPLPGPNDPAYTSGQQYYLPTMQAARAWNLTRGIAQDGPVGIAFSDWFPCELDDADMHPDLAGKLTIVDCDSEFEHGIPVSSVAGANTDNGQFIASLGWNTRLYGFEVDTPRLSRLAWAATSMNSPLYGDIDVVNFSWTFVLAGYTDSNTYTAVERLLKAGIVVTGAAGNSRFCVPGGSCGTCSGMGCAQYFYPAAHNYVFPDGNGSSYKAQVIATSATDQSDEFRDGFVYSKGTNPLGNATTAYIDVAAPGVDILFLNVDGLPDGPYTYTTDIDEGTSFSAPLVAAQAALVLSVNPTLRVDEVYDIITRSAVEVDTLDHPNTFFYSAPDTGESLSWNRYVGYGRADAFRALKRTLETKGGYLAQDLVIPAGETWNFGAVTVAFAPGSGVVVSGTMNADGTTFAEAEAGQGWDGIAVYGSGRLDFDGVTVAEAAVGVTVRSDGNTFTRSVFTGNGVGILSDFECPFASECPDSNRSSFTLAQSCVIESVYDAVAGLEGYGVWARYADVQITQSTIETNDAYGLRLDEADVSAYKLLLTGNGVDPISLGRDGAQILPGGDLTLSSFFSGSSGTQSSPSYAAGLNSLRDNAEDEIGVELGGYTFIGDICGITTCPTSNRVSESGFPGDGDYLIDNEATQIIKASRTYWATTPPDPPDAAFSNPALVEDYQALSSDPATDAGRPGGCTFSSARGTPGSTAARYGDGEVSSLPALTPEDAAWLSGRIDAMRVALAANPAGEGAAALAQQLYVLQRLDRADELGEHARTLAMLADLHAPLAGNAPLAPTRRATAEVALVASVHDALRHGSYDEANALLNASGGYVEDEGARRVLDLAAVALDEQGGRYESALARLDAVLAGLGAEEAQLARDLGATVALLEARLAGPEAAVTPGREASATEASVLARGVAETALLPVYPNPTRGRAAVRLALAEASEVTVAVFDVLGRRVALLHEGQTEAGVHRLGFDGASLPSGVYLVRAVVGAPGGASRALTRRLTLLR